jgi:hypothetical protein
VTAPHLAPDFKLALGKLCAAASGCLDPWWIIGSGAAALHGVPDILVHDVDVVVSVRDAQMLAEHWALVPPPPQPDALFYSEIYFQVPSTGLTVEVMAGFKVKTNGVWWAAAFATRTAMTGDFGTVYVPDLAEVQQLFLRFGRPKDIDRAHRVAEYLRTL